jgi:hypothetical protein
MTRRIALCFTAACLSLSQIALADVTFGGNSRAFGMGGAGIAVLDMSGRTSAINPAAVGLLNRRSILEFPHLGFRTSGIPFGKAFDHATGKSNASDLATFARDFGGRESSVGFGAGWGIRMGHMDLRTEGIGTIRVQPNDQFQAWAKAGGDITNVTPGMRADLLGAAIYTLPTIGFAERISPPGSDVRVTAGARVKLSRALYSHYFVDAASVAANGNAIEAPELNGKSHLEKTGIGVDLGLLIHSDHHYGWSGAAVVTNLVEPNFRFDGTDRNGNPFTYDMQPRTVSVGTAWRGNRVVAAIDGVDLGQAYGARQGRMGIEYGSKGWAIRGGYSTERGFTIGLGLKFLDIAIGARQPLGISQVLRF